MSPETIWEIALNGAGWSDVSGQVVILIGLIAGLLTAVRFKQRQQMLFA